MGTNASKSPSNKLICSSKVLDANRGGVTGIAYMGNPTSGKETSEKKNLMKSRGYKRKAGNTEKYLLFKRINGASSSDPASHADPTPQAIGVASSLLS
jgi:hypothetical protein